MVKQGFLNAIFLGESNLNNIAYFLKRSYTKKEK